MHALWHKCTNHKTLVHVVFSQLEDEAKRSWLLLDSGSMCSVVCNASLLSNIHNVDKGICISCDTSKKTVNQKGWQCMGHTDLTQSHMHPNPQRASGQTIRHCVIMCILPFKPWHIIPCALCYQKQHTSCTTLDQLQP